jgi:uncharacterized membrane protein YhaH (DUF805 family)
MKIRQVLFSFNGTITRKQWWIYTSAAFIFLFWVVFPALFTLGIVLISPMMRKTKWTYAAEIIVVFSIYVVPMLAVWCFLALNIKRLRERGRKWMAMTILLVLSLMFYMAVLSVPAAIADLVYSRDFYSLIVCPAFFLIGLWPLIELGFFKGTIELDSINKK